MPFVKIYIHLVCSTKNRERLLKKEKREDIFKHIKENARKKDIYIDFIGGYYDHMHILISMGVEQTISKIMQLIKGESSHWINKNKITPTKFAWQKEYYGASVSPQNIDSVRNYIKNQSEHHRKITFKEEMDEFIKKYGFKKFG